MNNLKVTGKQNFMGKQIPIVLGGFGEDKKCISDKVIAEIHDMEIFHVRELINRNEKRFTKDVDIVDLKAIVMNDNNLVENLGYSKMQISKAEHIYILSERGYAKLIKIMDTDLAWEIHDKLIDEYFELRESQMPKDYPSALRAYADEVEQRQALEEKNSALVGLNETMKPKAEYFDALVDKKLLTSFRDTAGELMVKEKIFVGFLIDNGFVYRASNGKLKPYANKNNGLFAMRDITNKKNGYVGTQTYITPKGKETFRLLLKKYMDSAS